MEWKGKISAFKQIDVRSIQGNFFQGLIPGEKVLQTGHQRSLRPDHHHADAIVQHKFPDGLEIIVVQCHVGAALACAGIARCYVQFVALRTFGDFRRHCVFPSAGTK